MKIAVFPGSFDPITLGHKDIIDRALPLFDKIIIAIGTHHEKQAFFDLESRKNFILQVFNNPKVEIVTYSGLTGAFCQLKQAPFLIRGIRNSLDFEYEKDIAQNNAQLFGIETLFFMSKPELSHISSTIVRELLKHKSDIQHLIPKNLKIF
jgi:pantetheine-phosphate adenylyltransferase